MPVCLLRLHVEHACAAMANGWTKDSCHVLRQLSCKLPPDDALLSHCISCTCQQGCCQALHSESCWQGVDDHACVRAQQPAGALAHWDAHGWLHALCWQPDKLVICCCEA